MQIPSSTLAASVTSITASKVDRSPTTASPTTTAHVQVDSAGQSNPDRDAQGQGDGLGTRDHKNLLGITDEQSDSSEPAATDLPAPTLPDEPKSLLDLLG